MNIGSVITTYRKKMNLSQAELAALVTDMGHPISQKGISKWEQGSTEPNATVFIQLCQLLHITDIYQAFSGHNPYDTFSLLNEEGKEKLYDYMQLLLDSGKYNKNTRNTINNSRRIKLFTLPASAGTGQFLDNDDFEEIEVSSEMPIEIDFGIRIAGNSMEPRFVDNQIVWIHKQPTLQNGEIGIFYLNGEAYCKQLDKTKKGISLISLNKEYAPIVVGENDEFEVFGKVVW